MSSNKAILTIEIIAVVALIVVGVDAVLRNNADKDDEKVALVETSENEETVAAIEPVLVPQLVSSTDAVAQLEQDVDESVTKSWLESSKAFFDERY